MMDLATLTMNPTIDVACEVERLEPVRKLRGSAARHDPGGGGINVARVFVRLGGNARCHYLAGGATGVALDGLLDLHQLVREKTPIAGETRVCTTVIERVSGLEYRIVPEGPEVARDEWQACLDRLADLRCDYLVACGSLPRGVPEDFYARTAQLARKAGMRFVLDSSGEALAQGLAHGGVFLVKPNRVELQELTGSVLDSEAAIADAAMAIVERGDAEYLAVTMDKGGALLASARGTLRLPAIAVPAASTVGAGDSFVAAMVHGLASGKAPADAFRYGMAAGAAAVMTPGTDLARAADTERLYREMPGAV